ncbi:hypothetical protein GCM10007901_33330 [Dyella acidisoli]|uniref:GNAT family N-acetyltransferase n=2 Tax=Dyella acidisoli TaxID=1867834 RepID=A0ABQ5XSD9_9GAMM|nr:hypothetical protein GCM10007901_33330 [Dyella acidisoli]
MRVWKDFPQSYATELSSVPGNMFPMISYPGTLVSLPNANREAYLTSLKSRYRHGLKKKLKNSTAICLEADILQRPNGPIMDEIFELFWKTYEKGKTKFEKLNRRFFDLMASHHQSYFVVLRDRNTNKIVAFMLCFHMGKHAINKFIGIDYSQPKEWFLYYRLWDAAVQFVASLGGESIQSGQTGYTAKLKLGHKLVPLYNYVSHKNPIVHWIYSIVARNISWDTLNEDLALYLQAHPDEKVSCSA